MKLGRVREGGSDLHATPRDPGRGRRSLSATVLLLLAAVVLGGCSQLAGALASAIPTPAEAATRAPAATSPGPDGHVGSHAIVCVEPITPGGGGPPCVPVSDALVVAAATDVLTPAERATVNGSSYVPGGAGCAGTLQHEGCRAPDVPLGVVTFHLNGGGADVRVLVYRSADGSLGATRLA